MKTASPLRYPGGKWRLKPFFGRLISINGMDGRDYIEPYAGGAGLALSLLYEGAVRRIHLNDLAPSVFSVWWAILNRPKHVKRFIETVPLNMRTWERQKITYSDGVRRGRLAFACAVLYLNRTNHSGILNGGVIGGKAQQGEWLIGARFNREQLASRVDAIWSKRSRISIHNREGREFLLNGDFDRGGLVYLDPPYVEAGKTLYLNAYTLRDHTELSRAVRRYKGKWVVSYDHNPFVKRLYKGFPSRRLELLHTARVAKTGEELLFFSKGLRIPRLKNATS